MFYKNEVAIEGDLYPLSLSLTHTHTTLLLTNIQNRSIISVAGCDGDGGEGGGVCRGILR